MAELTKEDCLKELKQDIEKKKVLRDNMSKNILDMSVKSIEQYRRWVFEVITISSAILGVFVFNGINSPLVKNANLVLFALFFLIANIVYGIWHLKTSIEKDMNNLPKQSADYNKYFTTIIEAEELFCFEPTKDNFDKMQKKRSDVQKEFEERAANPPKLDYSSDIIIGMFFAALLFIALSMLITSSDLVLFKNILLKLLRF